jgi:shikimate kinase
LTGEKIALIGMMASGKTTVGGELARRMGRPFVDADAALEERIGMTVPECFARMGETGFRRRERETLRDLLARPEPAVIGLGGGAYMQEEIRRELGSAAVTVYLRLSPGEILDRLGRTDISRRPMLSGPDWRIRARELLEERDPVYRGADIVVEADRLDPGEAAAKIEAELAESAAPGGDP